MSIQSDGDGRANLNNNTPPPEHQIRPQAEHPPGMTSNLHAVLQQVELQQAAQLLAGLPLPPTDPSNLMVTSDLNLHPPSMSHLLLRGLSPQPGTTLEAHGDSASSKPPTLMRLGGLEGLLATTQQKQQEQPTQPPKGAAASAPTSGGRDSLQQCGPGANGDTTLNPGVHRPYLALAAHTAPGSQQGAGAALDTNEAMEPRPAAAAAGGGGTTSQAPVQMHPLLAQLQVGSSDVNPLQGLAGVLGGRATTPGGATAAVAGGPPVGERAPDWQQMLQLQHRPNHMEATSLFQSNGSQPLHSLLANLQPSVLQGLQQLMQHPAPVPASASAPALHPLLATHQPSHPISSTGLMQALTGPIAQMLQQQQQQQQEEQQRQLHHLLQSAVAHAKQAAMNGG